MEKHQSVKNNISEISELPPEQQEIFRLYEEGFRLDGDMAIQHRQEVDDLALEMTSAEVASALRRMAYLAINRSRVLSSPERQTSSKEVELDFSKIGWLSRTDKIMISAVETKPYEGENITRRVYLADLTSITPQTHDAMEHLGAQFDASGDNVREKLMEQLTDRVLPQFCGNLLTGQRMRPVNAVRGKRTGNNIGRTIDTEYPSYKLNVQGTNNRAIISVLDRTEEHMVLGLLAMYDHEDQVEIFRAITI